MPLTAEQIKWVEEQDRIKKSLAEEKERQRLEKANSKALAKGKNNDKAKSKPSKTKRLDDKSIPQPAKFSPVFDSINVAEAEANGPMRRKEIEDCERIEVAFRKYHNLQDSAMTKLSEKLRRALITPQDKPECLSSFQLRGPTDGLRKNPNPSDTWRKFNPKKTKAKGKMKKKGK